MAGLGLFYLQMQRLDVALDLFDSLDDLLLKNLLAMLDVAARVPTLVDLLHEPAFQVIGLPLHLRVRESAAKLRPAPCAV